MKTFLIVVAGVVVGFLVLGALALAWIKRRVGNVYEAITQMTIAGGITPFRIHLEKTYEPEWQDAEGIEIATRGFEALDYVVVGDYTVTEMENVRLRAFFFAETGHFAVLYEHDEFGLFAETVREFEDGTQLTVSCAPESGMDRPIHAPLHRLELDICEAGSAEALHERILHESIGREPIEAHSAEFVQLFTEAYAQEMDWRIARGGVTPREIERIAELSGQDTPDDDQVEMIRSMWQMAIGGFIEEEVTTLWLADSGLSAVEWEALRDRVAVVHDHGEADERIEELAWQIVDATTDMDDDEAVERAHDAAVEQVRPCFEGRSNRDGFEAAQVILPEKRRYERLGSVEAPWPADLWVVPEQELS